MMKTFLLSNLPEFREMLQIENTDYVTLEVEVDTCTNERLGEGVLTKEDLELISEF